MSRIRGAEAFFAEQHSPPAEDEPKPIPMLLWCPICRGRHIDEGEFEQKVHHTHACQHCGHVWRPAIVPTTGVHFLPGFKNAGRWEHCSPELLQQFGPDFCANTLRRPCACGLEGSHDHFVKDPPPESPKP